MARKSVEPGISYDDQKKKYYVLLSRGTDEQGKSSKSYRVVGTLKEARALRKEHDRQKKQGKVLPANSDTLAARVERHIDYKELKLSATTIYGYRNILNRHIRPYFKNRRIQDVSTADMKKYVVAKTKSLSKTTVRRHIDLLNSVFDAAKRERVILENPIDFMDKVTPDTKEKGFYTPEETAKLLNSVKDSQIKVAVYLAVCLGLRRGEVLGLRWEDVDLEKGVITIKHNKTQAGEKTIEKEPKTASGYRKLAIVQPLYDVLRQEKEREPIRRDMAEKRESNDFVVTMSDGKPMRPNYLSDLFGEHIKKHNLKKITFHGLRHTYATIAANEGASIQEISTSLGHAGIGVTASVYTHRFDEVKKVASEKVAASFVDLLEP